MGSAILGSDLFPKLGSKLCWSILYVNLTGLRVAQVAGKTVLLGVPRRVFSQRD